LTTVSVYRCPFYFSDLQLEKLEKLEDIDFVGRCNGEDDFKSLKQVLNLPKLKNLRIIFLNFDLSFESSLDDEEELNALKEKLDFEIANYLEDVESVKNREDKKVLAIRTLYPEELLVESVANPEEVKYLNIYLSYDSCFNIFRFDCKKLKYCENCKWHNEKYNDRLCKDIVNFKNLERLVLYDINLRDDLWYELGKNSNCLKEIYLRSFLKSNFNFEGKKEGLQSIFEIKTLEKVELSNICLSVFPKGPSNIKYIKMECIYSYMDGSYNNFHTHQNLETVIVKGTIPIINDNINIFRPFNFSTLRLEKLEKLEELEYEGKLDGENGLKSLRALLRLPKLKKLKLYFKNFNSLNFEGNLTDDKNNLKSFTENLECELKKLEINV